MASRFSHKKSKHTKGYAYDKLRFVPLVVSTFGVLHEDFMRLLWLTTSASRGSGLAVGEVREQGFGAGTRKLLFAKLRSRVSVLAARTFAMRYEGFCGVFPRLFPSYNYEPSDPSLLLFTTPVGEAVGPVRDVFLGG